MGDDDEQKNPPKIRFRSRWPTRWTKNTVIGAAVAGTAAVGGVSEYRHGAREMTAWRERTGTPHDVAVAEVTAKAESRELSSGETIDAYLAANTAAQARDRQKEMELKDPTLMMVKAGLFGAIGGAATFVAATAGIGLAGAIKRKRKGQQIFEGRETVISFGDHAAIGQMVIDDKTRTITLEMSHSNNVTWESSMALLIGDQLKKAGFCVSRSGSILTMNGKFVQGVSSVVQLGTADLRRLPGVLAEHERHYINDTDVDAIMPQLEAIASHWDVQDRERARGGNKSAPALGPG